MATFEFLHEALGNPEMRVDVPSDALGVIPGSVPAEIRQDLAALWQEDGWSRYGGGLLWTVDPRVFLDLQSTWANLKPEALVFARSAFGDLFVWQAGGIDRLELQTGESLRLGSDLYNFLNDAMTRGETHEIFFHKSLFEDLRRRLGDLAADECYGLKLALALGGSDEPENYHRVKLREYVAITGQMHE